MEFLKSTIKNDDIQYSNTAVNYERPVYTWSQNSRCFFVHSNTQIIIQLVTVLTVFKNNIPNQYTSCILFGQILLVHTLSKSLCTHFYQNVFVPTLSKSLCKHFYQNLFVHTFVKISLYTLLTIFLCTYFCQNLFVHTLVKISQYTLLSKSLCTHF